MGRALLVLESPQDRQKAVTWIGKAPVGTRVEFKASKRSLPQNDLMWALLTEVSQQYEHNGRKYDPASWKAIFLHAFGREISFLPSLDMRSFLPIELSSSDLSKDEMTNFIEFVIKEGTERGVVFREINNEASDATVPPASVDGSAEPSPGALQEPAGDPPHTEPAGSISEPDMFGKFNFAEGELQHLKDFARKALDDAEGDGLAASIETRIEGMALNYRDAVETTEALSAIDAMQKAIFAVVSRKRSREQAAAYIARDILDCPAEQLEGRK